MVIQAFWNLRSFRRRLLDAEADDHSHARDSGGRFTKNNNDKDPNRMNRQPAIFRASSGRFLAKQYGWRHGNELPLGCCYCALKSLFQEQLGSRPFRAASGSRGLRKPKRFASEAGGRKQAVPTKEANWWWAQANNGCLCQKPVVGRFNGAMDAKVLYCPKA